MQLGIFAKTFAGVTPGEVLPAVAAAGFSAAQYNMACSGLPSMPDAIPASALIDIATAAGSAEVAIVALSGTYNMIHPEPERREQGHRRLEILAIAAAALPTTLVTLCTGTRDRDDQWRAHKDNEGEEAWADLLTSMERAISIAERHDILLGIEPELANVVNSALKARRLVDAIGSRRLKIVLDPANLFESETLEAQRRVVSTAVDLLADCIVLAHAKDRTAEGAFVAAGRGVLDYPHFLSCLKAAEFDGPLVAHGLAAAEAPAVAAFLRETLGKTGITVS